LRFTNQTGLIWYLANNFGYPSLGLSGLPCRQTAASATSVDSSTVPLRGERSLVVGLPQIQTDLAARRTAHRLRCDLRYPVAVIDKTKIFGDARRQPGDLVRVDDPLRTGAAGVWRIMAVSHEE